MVTSITFRDDNNKDEEVLKIANELNQLENRGSPTNALRVFIKEAGQVKIAKLEAKQITTNPEHR